ncbi:MAG: hypothetical protein AAF549_07870 [Pseudomonadota bacterium]
MIKHLIFYVLTAAVKDKIFLSYLALVAVTTSLSIFFGASSVNEQDQFAIVFTSGSLRIISVFTLVLFIVFYFARSFENRDVEFLFSKPITRWQYIISHFFAFTLLSFLIATTETLALMLISGENIQYSILLWGLSVFVELSVISAISIFFGIAFSNAVSATLSTFGFYVLARLIGDIIGILESGISNIITETLGKVMLVISFFVPRLDLMGQSSWLVYGVEDFNIMALSAQMIIFLGLILSATYLDLTRRQF